MPASARADLGSFSNRARNPSSLASFLSRLSMCCLETVVFAMFPPEFVRAIASVQLRQLGYPKSTRGRNMRLRRCAILYVTPRERLAFDLGAIMQGATGVSSVVEW